MRRTGRFLLTVGLAALMGSSVQAQPTAAPKVEPKPAIQPAPTRIIRNPPALRLAPKTLTHRVLTKTQLAELVQRGGTVTPVIGKVSAGPPGKTALVVILENGGIMNNVDPDLRQRLNVDIRTVQCGQWEYELKAGETIPELLGRIAGQLAGNLECVNPANWRQTTFNPYTWLNQQTDTALENAVKAHNSLLNTQSHYDQVVVLEDADAVPARAIAAIRQLAPSHVLDIHVLTHGGNEFFVGHAGASFNQATFFGPLKADKDAGRLHIRAVYQMNCVSGTLKDNWVSLGATVVNGTQAQYLNNMPHQYFHFLERWVTREQGMSTASQGSFEDAAFYTRPIYGLIGRGDKVDTSRLTTTGRNVNATVETAL
jgi:hypothetical protein